jgi:hypothetical protein
MVPFEPCRPVQVKSIGSIGLVRQAFLWQCAGGEAHSLATEDYEMVAVLAGAHLGARSTSTEQAAVTCGPPLCGFSAPRIEALIEPTSVLAHFHVHLPD